SSAREPAVNATTSIGFCGWRVRSQQSRIMVSRTRRTSPQSYSFSWLVPAIFEMYRFWPKVRESNPNDLNGCCPDWSHWYTRSILSYVVAVTMQCVQSPGSGGASASTSHCTFLAGRYLARPSRSRMRTADGIEPRRYVLPTPASPWIRYVELLFK